MSNLQYDWVDAGNYTINNTYTLISNLLYVFICLSCGHCGVSFGWDLGADQHHLPLREPLYFCSWRSNCHFLWYKAGGVHARKWPESNRYDSVVFLGCLTCFFMVDHLFTYHFFCHRKRMYGRSGQHYSSTYHCQCCNNHSSSTTPSSTNSSRNTWARHLLCKQ